MLDTSKLEQLIGKNIKEVRNSKQWSLARLSRECGISSSTLSQYENSGKLPNLITAAKIANALQVSIDRLFYGDENILFINTASSEGRKIVNSVYKLWEMGVANYYENLTNVYGSSGSTEGPRDIYLHILKYPFQIKRLINSLNEFSAKKNTFEEPDKYLEMILSSIANEINEEIKKERKKENEKKKK